MKEDMDRSLSSRLQHQHHSASSSNPNPTSAASASSANKVLQNSKASVKRKPVPSPTATSPSLYHHPPQSSSNAAVESPSFPRDLDQYPRGYSPQVQNGPPFNFPSVIQEATDQSERRHRSRQASESKVNDASKFRRVPVNQGLQRAKSLHPTGKALPAENIDEEPVDPAMITKTPRSPGPNKLTSFFGWKTSPTPAAERSPSPRSDSNYSPGPSPISPSPNSMAPSKGALSAIDTTRANANMNGFFLADTGFPAPPVNGHSYSSSAQIDDLEDELREVSSELAGSIRREMELEDLVDRLQMEASQPPELGRRTSDYFSDSGSGSTRYPGSDAGVNKTDDLAKQKRLSEQEKAQYKLSLSQKLASERDQRKVLEAHISQMTERMQNIDQERALSSGVANRVRELESSLEDHRRRLHEEKRAKENFEDILAALKDQITQSRDERDNLRDEIVPQLKARLEGLEASAAESQKLTYENTRMSQELQSLKNENTTLMNARRLQLEMQQNSSRFNAIAEEGGPSPTDGTGLGLMRSTSTRGGGLTRSGSLKRSNSISSKEREFNERVKDIEMQRDALHKALKLLLDRQNYQRKEHEKTISVLELERDRALQNQSPRRMGYEKEVTGLKYEINQLRRRADDAIQQKWQCEKGLGGLKIDLDRAEQETSSLRALLHEHDILLPDRPGSRSKEIEHDAHVSSGSLENAFRELQRTQALSLSKIKEMHGDAASSTDDAEMSAMMEKLLRSMSNAENERALAQKQAAMFRAEAESLKQSEVFHSDENAGLGDQLRSAANRIESLSTQVRMQLEGNKNLRQRLTEAVTRGEEDQKNSTTRITSMQGRLKELEDKLVTAQQSSEDIYAQHEEEVRNIKESHNAQLQRLKTGIKVRTPSQFGSPRASSAMSPIFQARSPRLDRTTSGIGKSLDEALRTQFLEKRVAELEGALGDADKEMEEVVSKMNLAQIEVMELQSARDEAMRQTRKLQAEIDMEKEKVDAITKTGFFKR